MAVRPSEPGRPIWLELNAQRVTEGIRFYESLFAWSARPLHVPPWGAIPLIASDTRTFGNQFMAMGAFALPKWNLWFAADLETALARIPEAGGLANPEIVRLAGHSEEVHGQDPSGLGFNLMRPDGWQPPEHDRPGEPMAAEYWGPEARRVAAFFAAVLGLDLEETARGARLVGPEGARLFFTDPEFELIPPRWIPYLRTASLGGDLERARRLGAVPQMPEAEVDGLGRLAVLADPAGACFGLVQPS
ncbi:MAG: VOC family protein [Pseudomonadota bacterium]